MNLEDISLLLAPLAVGLMIICTHAPLGFEVLRRGIIFIDLALAQVAGLGIVVAELAGIENHTVIQVLALSFAFAAALLFRLAERMFSKYQEAIIGVSYIFSAALSMLLLSQHAHGAESFQHLLSGEMLFVSWDKILFHLPIYLFVLTAWFSSPKSRQGILFYLLFSLAITSSVQLVGVYLVFTSLIVPALAALIVGGRLLTAYFIGFAGIVLGLAGSVYSDLPSTACVVATTVFIATVVIVTRGGRLRIDGIPTGSE